MLSDLLFSKTHRVEQLVDINKKKKVDKVLLKVVKTVRNKCNTNDWIKVDSNLKSDLNLSDKNIKSICSTLSEFYEVDLNPATVASVQDIVCFIKAHRPSQADSIFLSDASTLDIDENDDLSKDPKENLEVDPEIVKKSEPSDPTSEEAPEGTKPSTELGSTIMLISGLALATGAIGAISYFKAKNSKEFNDWIEKHYSEICKFIKEKLSNDPTFFSNRNSLWRLDELIRICKEREANFIQIKNMPEPYPDEPIRLYENKLRRYFTKNDTVEDKGLMKKRKDPLAPEYLTIDEAGFLDAGKTKSFIKKLHTILDLQDEIDTKLDNIRKRTVSKSLIDDDDESYGKVLDAVRVMSYRNLLYREPWVACFPERVLKPMANAVKQYKEQANISKEQLSVESLQVKKETTDESWGNVFESL